jgi:hypothetical protein
MTGISVIGRGHRSASSAADSVVPVGPQEYKSGGNPMIHSITDMRFTLVMALCLVALIVRTEASRSFCDALHRVTVDGKSYAGGCTSVHGYRGQLALMSLAPVFAILAMFRPRISLRRFLGLLVILALELAAISWTVPGRALAHPHLIRADPASGRMVLILAK